MPFTRAQRTALAELAELWRDRAFVLIGAGALEVHLPLNRETRDLDITLAADLDEFPAGLDTLPGWTRHPRLEQEWHGPEGVRVDVLPAGPGLRAQGYVDWPSGARMRIIGFGHVFQRSTPVEIDDGICVQVAQPHVIAFLKMLSYLDRPIERGRDLADLAVLFEHYIDDDHERRWSDEVIAAGTDFENVSSFLLGVDLGRRLAPDERSQVDRLLEMVEQGRGRRELLERAPALWRRDPATLQRRLAAFRRGFVLG